MSETIRSRRLSGEHAAGVGRDPSSRSARAQGAKQLRCAFCQAELSEGRELMTQGSGALGKRIPTSRFCSAYCRDCVLALVALAPSPLASSEFIARRGLLSDRLLALWRHGRGPEPALVLQAAEAANRGLASADAD